MYHVLALVLTAAPDKETIATLATDDFYHGIRPWLEAGAEERWREFQDQWTEGRETCDEIRRDYDAMFRVPAGRFVFPNETSHREPRLQTDGSLKPGLVCGPTSDDVIRYYHVAGLEVSPQFLELPDHVALELEFMAHLCGKLHQSSESGDADLAEKIEETLRGFFCNHLIQWVPALMQTVAARAGTRFWKAVAGLAASFLNRERQIIPPLPAPPGG
ncbi:MAG: molecular chaperone TorD family protein [Candidatus Sumerlaeia bacterium]